MTVCRPEIFGVRYLFLVSLALGGGGYLLNLVPLELGFGLSFVLGGVFALALARFCFWPAILCAVLSGAATYQLWGHGYAAIVFVLNVAFVAWSARNRRMPFLFPDALFWTLMGIPLVWAAYRYGLGIQSDAASAVAVKQALNNIFLSLVAHNFILILKTALIARSRYRFLGIQKPAVSMREFLSAIMSTLVLVPIFAAFVVSSQRHFDFEVAWAKSELTQATNTMNGHLKALHQSKYRSAELFIRRFGAVPDGDVLIYVGHNEQRKIFYREFIDFGSGVIVPETGWLMVPKAAVSLLDGVYHFGNIANPYLKTGSLLTNRSGPSKVELWAVHEVVEGWLTEYFIDTEVSIACLWGCQKDLNLPEELRSGRSGEPVLVIGRQVDGSLMQEWRAGHYYKVMPIGISAGKNFHGLLRISLRTFYDRLTSEIRYGLFIVFLAVIFVLFLQSAATAKINRNLSQLPRSVEVAARGGTESRDDDYGPCFSEISEVTDAAWVHAKKLALANADLQKSRELFDNIMTTSSIVYIVFASTGAGLSRKPVYISNSMEKLFWFRGGRTQMQAVVSDWLELPFHPEDRVAFCESESERNSALARNLVWRTQVRVQTQEDTWSHFDMTMWLSPFDNHQLIQGGDREVFCIMADATGRVEAERQLVHRSRLADIGVLATGIAHELNQPLNIIKLASTNLADRIADNDIDKDTAMSKLDVIIGEVDRAAKITNNMRLFGRTEERPIEAVSLSSLLEETLLLFDTQHALKRIIVKTEVPEEPVSVLADASKLQQVLSNILLNCCEQIEETREGNGGEDEILLRVFPGELVKIQISDCAGGIDPALLSSIFQPFVTSRPPGKGTGLGMSVAYGIVKEMNGELTAENRGGGAVFTIKLPQADSV